MMSVTNGECRIEWLWIVAVYLEAIRKLNLPQRLIY